MEPLLIRKKRYARPAGGSYLHGKRRLKNLFENFALEHRCRRTNAKTFSPLQKHDLVGVFARKIKLVRDDDNGVAVLRGEPAQGFEKIHLGADIEVQRRLVEKQEEWLLGESAGENHALLFAAGDLIHGAIAQIGHSYLG